MQIAAKVIVKGLVQGVGYRYFCYRKAIEYEINGYAKNLFNGDVELEIEGEKNMINEFLKELKLGPANAKVNSLLIKAIPFENKYDDFTVY